MVKLICVLVNSGRLPHQLMNSRSLCRWMRRGDIPSFTVLVVTSTCSGVTIVFGPPSKHSLRALVHRWTSNTSSNQQSSALQNVSVYRWFCEIPVHSIITVLIHNSGHFGPPLLFWAPGPGLPMAIYATVYMQDVVAKSAVAESTVFHTWSNDSFNG